MTSPALRKIALGLFVAPLALGLAACGDKAAESEAPVASEALATVAPPEGTEWASVISKTEDGGYRMGNPDAPIKLVEYGALSCSHCALFAEESFADLRDNYVKSGRVSYEIRFFMLNPYDFSATMLATCGSDEAVIPLAEQFWAWQPNMFENLQSAGEEKLQQIGAMPRDKQFAALAEASGMTDFFASRGISKEQGAQCLAKTETAQALADQTDAAGKEKNITGTPTFFINGANVGSMEWKPLEAKLQQAGAR
ncbi:MULTISPECIES: thioredoxin domain-containing protein [Novosphingobium]|uniref:Thioredoxin domain-containing protein n=1 Tax=Novosphingobium decolorationis TaxID=2698673 RepID=A0ABX8E507_9SPHN|nr:MULTISPECIES: thioredoxin domain-containing protein [Novosphingobium]MED5546310.1 thioredoxin domain-containing protein [Pseudomonadota bacterium]QVM84241.1 thioredoxin domain-containing protein [Novosphingobium decolorationis]GAM04882.1 protein-disulfide isomerase [Novosphingobium sp. MBES04]